MWPFDYLRNTLFGVNRIEASVAALAKSVEQNAREIRSLADEIRASLKFLRTRAAYVGPLTLQLACEQEDGMLRFVVPLPPFSATDVVKGELTVRVQGGNPLFFDTTKEDSEVADSRLLCPDNGTVELSYRFQDDAGNWSEPRTLVVQVTDTIAPPQPGELALVVAEEIADAPEEQSESLDDGSSEQGGEVAPTEASDSSGETGN